MTIRMTAKNEIVLYGTVGVDFWDEDYFTARQVREALASMSGDITVRLNSGGGIADEGQAIYRSLAEHDGNVRIVIDGAAASAASLIAMAGDEIIMPAGSWMLIHDPANAGTFGRGTQNDHEHMARMLDVIASSYAGVYAAKAGITVEQARQIMRDETVYGPADAFAMGFATHVDEMATASAAAPFPYHVYANAPKGLAGVPGARPAKEAVMAMVAGMPRVSGEDVSMTDKPNPAAGSPAAEDVKDKAATVEPKRDAQEMIAQAVSADRQRSRRIIEMGARMNISMAVVNKLIDDGATAEAAAMAFIDAKVDAGGEERDPNPRPTAKVIGDAQDRFAEGATRALMAKAGFKEGGERNEFSSMSLMEMARHSIMVSGRKVMAADRFAVVAEAFGTRMAGAAHSTSDFPSILENIASKSMLRGFDEVEETFEQWTSTGTLSDFKPTKRVGIDPFPELSKILEDGEYTYGSMGDYSEAAVLATYGKLFKITRNTIIDDDMGAFTDLPRKMGRAARRTIGNLAYMALTGNPVMSDGNPLFHANHRNLAASGGAPSVTSLEAAIAAMATQKDRSEQTTALNIRPEFLLAPYALRGTVSQLLASEYDPSKTTRAANTVRNAVTPIYDARLDTASTAAWYLAASPMSGDTIEISYLDGNQTPFLDSQNGWNVDGVEFKVRIDAAVTVLAWEGLYKNAGQ